MIKGNRTINNAIWIIVCKIVQSVLSVLVTMFSARYFGPANYGIINYATSVVAFAAPMMKLGFTTTLVDEFVSEPDRQGETLGTALVMNLISAFISMAGVAAFVSVANPGEKTTLIVCVLYSLNLPFQALEMTQYWFQSQLKSKYTSVTMLMAYIVVSIYKLILLFTGKGIYWFAVTHAIDYAIISIALLVIYRKIGGPRISFSLQRGKAMLAKSYHYILSSLMITIFAQTDKIMLKSMMGNEATGLYSAAVTCAGMTSFVFAAIIDSAKPVILEARKKGHVVFEERMTILYSVVTFLALAQSVVITILADLIIKILYGSAYADSACVLRLAVWYTTFSYLGSARTVWMLGEKKHNLLWTINMSGALTNVFFNFILIPFWGAMGAAFASLVTQVFTNFLIGFIHPQLRSNTMLILRGLNPKYMIHETKRMYKGR